MSTDMILGVSGSRGWKDRATVRTVLHVNWFRGLFNAVVTGTAPGPDTYAKEWCDEHGVPCETLDYKPYISKYGPKVAPIIRDKEVAKKCGILCAFWDKESRGTKHTMDFALKEGKPVYVITDSGPGYEYTGEE